MSKVFRDVSGVTWGFYTKAEQRMHLQVIEPKELKYKIWFEENGYRIFEPIGKIPDRVLTPLRKIVEADDRWILEVKWTKLIIDKSWIKVKVNHATGAATFTVYPNSRDSFVRVENLSDYVTFPDFYAQGNYRFDRNTCSLVLNAKAEETEQEYVPLPEILWLD
jgi:hypothetical protein